MTNVNHPFIAEAMNDAHGTAITPEFFKELGQATLRMEKLFNLKAGFAAQDDDLT
ncbi:MAG: hypothetical protein R2865_00515 [Deinococcales bacterium]